MQIKTRGLSLRYSSCMAERQEHQPGTRAPVTGHYEELNVFGTPTGRVEHVQEGEHLPLGPRGFTWRQTEQEGC